MGLEPTTFCMANASHVRARSRPFAQIARFQGLRPDLANASEPERTANLAILATSRMDPSSCGERLRRLDHFLVERRPVIR
jgi:hypothetical protein